MNIFKNKWRNWTVLTTIAGIVAILYSIVFIIRFNSVLSQSDLFMTTGVEGPGIYAIWKVQNGHPLYEWPNQDFYTLTIYNYLFYYFYAAVLSVFRISDANILIYGKLITLLFALGGAIAHWLMMRYIVKDKDSFLVSLYLAVMAFIVWFSASVTSWWIFTVRPDIPSVTLCTIALLIYLIGLDKKSFLLIVTSSLVFFLSWSFKQSTVWIFAGTSLCSLIYIKNLRQALALIFPFAFFTMICLLVGGEIYKYNIITLPSISVLSFQQSIDEFKKIFFPNLAIWGFLIYLPLIFISLARNLKLGHTNSNKKFIHLFLNKKTVIIIVITVVTSVMGFVALGRFGSSKNHFFEAIIAATTLSSLSLVRLAEIRNISMRKLGLAIATVLILSMTIFPLLQLSFPNRVGLLTRSSQQAYDERKAYAQYLSQLPKPLFIRDEIFALPWHSSDNKYPAVILDQNIYFEAKNKGLFKGNGIKDLVKSQYFRSLLIREKDEVYKLAIDSGYQILSKPKSIPTASGNSRVKLVTLELRPLKRMSSATTPNNLI